MKIHLLCTFSIGLQTFTALASPRLAGTVVINNCSGSVVRFETSLKSDKAMVLTSGRCFEGETIAANDHLQNIPSSVDVKVLNAEFQVLGVLKTRKLLYAATSVDNLALYELTQTHEEISRSLGVEAFVLSRSGAKRDDAIDIISGKRRRTLSCEVNSFPKLLVEGPWTFLNSIYFSTYPVPGCHTLPGMEGSPVVLQNSKEIIAVDSTRNMATDQRCRFDNPCEVDLEGGFIAFGYQMSYGQQTHIIYGCLDEKNVINLAKPGCLLPPNRSEPTSPYSSN